MGARVYDPYTGTFTQPDPIQGGGLTTFGYANGDPVNQTDLNGEGFSSSGLCLSTHNCVTSHGKIKYVGHDFIDSAISTVTHAVARGAVATAKFAAHHYGTIAEVAGGGVCLAASAGTCAFVMAGAFAAATVQNATSGHFSAGAEALDALGAVPGAQSAAFGLRGWGTASQLLPLTRLGTATGWGADAFDTALETRAR